MTTTTTDYSGFVGKRVNVHLVTKDAVGDTLDITITGTLGADEFGYRVDEDGAGMLFSEAEIAGMTEAEPKPYTDRDMLVEVITDTMAATGAPQIDVADIVDRCVEAEGPDFVGKSLDAMAEHQAVRAGTAPADLVDATLTEDKAKVSVRDRIAYGICVTDAEAWETRVGDGVTVEGAEGVFIADVVDVEGEVVFVEFR
jgi:hypothetical protein